MPIAGAPRWTSLSTSRADGDVARLEASHTAGGKGKWCRRFGKRLGGSLKS